MVNFKKRTNLDNLPAYRYPIFEELLTKFRKQQQEELELLMSMQGFYTYVCQTMEKLGNSIPCEEPYLGRRSITIKLTPARGQHTYKQILHLVNGVGKKLHSDGFRNKPTPAVGDNKRRYSPRLYFLFNLLPEDPSKAWEYRSLTIEAAIPAGGLTDLKVTTYTELTSVSEVFYDLTPID